MGWAPGGSPSPTSIRRRSASGRQINSATRCCALFDGVELGGRQPRERLHDNNIICLSRLSDPPSLPIAALSVLQATSSLARPAWIFGKQLETGVTGKPTKGGCASSHRASCWRKHTPQRIQDAKQLSSVDP